ncbi:hypothetical protein AB0D65_15825 [Streptomyces griseoloalbus]|uniref:Uncharacterized protein n=1 Tax=Streptomyces griseoloalbus TaxID=67303 RepID=A0ABV3E5K8_9ACTN
MPPVWHDASPSITHQLVKAGLVWTKIRHAYMVDATVIGFTGTARHPKSLAVQLPDGRIALSQQLTTALASVVAPRLVP